MPRAYTQNAGECAAAIQGMNGKELDGRTITCNNARQRTYANEEGGEGGGGGGGAGGGGDEGQVLEYNPII
jgi:cold-inducible RNA-binding protein